MSLSEWDTMALDATGTPSRGRVESEGVSIEIHKNWLYLRDARSWAADQPFTNNVVAQIHEGELQYKKFRILARRGPQDGVFALVEVGYETNRQILAGCGVNGYSNPTWPCGHQDVASQVCGPDFEGSVCGHCEGPTVEPEWVGVTAESRDFLAAMIVERLREDPVASSILAGLRSALRFNQGDRFFADHLGTQVPVTLIGEAETPVLSRMVQNMAGTETGPDAEPDPRDAMERVENGE